MKCCVVPILAGYVLNPARGTQNRWTVKLRTVISSSNMQLNWWPGSIQRDNKREMVTLGMNTVVLMNAVLICVDSFSTEQ